MFIFTIWAMRIFGLTGMLGSILFITGDLLYNHIPGSKGSPALKMSQMPASRLLNAGTFGLVGCWFYTLASFHIYIAFRPAGDTFAAIITLAFAATMICYGISHAAFFAIAAGAQAAVQHGSEAESGGKLGNAFFQRLVYITYIPVGVFSGMMLYGIVARRSLYPVWMLIFMPIVLYLLRTPVTRILKGRLKELINDSYDNFIVLVFFVISTLALWNALVF